MILTVALSGVSILSICESSDRAVNIGSVCSGTLEAEDDVFSRQISPVDRRLVLPFDPLLQMEDVLGRRRLLPLLRNLGFGSQRDQVVGDQPLIEEREPRTANCSCVAGSKPVPIES